jgi:hypothetical protein
VLCLALVVLITVIGNAFLSGVLSGVFPRYQGRVAWLVVLLAALMAHLAFAARGIRNNTASKVE